MQALKPELAARFYVSSIGLFGSVVRDDSTPESDVDIIVDFNCPVGVAFIDLALYLEAQLKKKVDLVSRGGIKDKYFKAIEPDLMYV